MTVPARERAQEETEIAREKNYFSWKILADLDYWRSMMVAEV